MSFNKYKVGLIAVICCTAVSGCTTLGMSPTSNSPAPLALSANAASGDLLKELDGGLITRLQGSNLSRADRMAALQSEYRALEYTAPGEAVLWRGDKLSGQIVPSQPYRVGSQDCRQYEQIVVDQTAQSTVKGTACRNANGSWSLLS